MTSEVAPVEGLVVKTASGALGMVTRSGEHSYTVQVFQEGQVWVPMALARQQGNDAWAQAFKDGPPAE